MFRAEIQIIIDQCKTARDLGLSRERIRNDIVGEAIASALRRIEAHEFLDWIKDDREFAYFYWDVQQRGVCAKPREASALILEDIALDALE